MARTLNMTTGSPAKLLFSFALPLTFGNIFQQLYTVMDTAIALALLSALVIAVGMPLFGRHITMLFISREDMALALKAGETAYRYLCCMRLSLPVLYVLYVFMSAVQGMGNTVFPMYSAGFELVIRIAVALIVAQVGYREGIFFAEVGAWLGGAATQFLGYVIQLRKIKQSG